MLSNAASTIPLDFFFFFFKQQRDDVYTEGMQHKARL